MKTRYWIIRPDGAKDERTVDWPHAPGYARIKALVEPILAEARPGVICHMEHVSVLHEGKRASMFVDENGNVPGMALPLNFEATKVYHAASIALGEDHAGGVILTAPPIAGTAILFERNVWF